MSDSFQQDSLFLRSQVVLRIDPNPSLTLVQKCKIGHPPKCSDVGQHPSGDTDGSRTPTNGGCEGYIQGGGNPAYTQGGIEEAPDGSD